MCVTFFCLLPEAGKQQNIHFIIGFNRDQQTKRQTLKFGPFEDDKNIYAGRDILSGGTWLGINIKTGIMTILTNYHLPKPRLAHSRGQLVKQFLSTQFVSQKDSFEDIHKKINSKMMSILSKEKQYYSAFNLVIYHIPSAKMLYVCRQIDMKETFELKKNEIYGLCNSDLFTIWPKTQHGMNIFQKIVQNIGQKSQEEIFSQMEALMKDTTKFDEDPQEEAAIFIQNYYSKEQSTDRCTKQTFMAIFKKQEDKMNLSMRQITFNNQKPILVKENIKI